jgi:hypothetical protein
MGLQSSVKLKSGRGVRSACDVPGFLPATPGRVANPKMISYPPTMLHFTSEFTGDPDDIIAARNRGFQMLDSIH